MDGDALKLQAEATARGLAEVVRAQQGLQDSVQRLQAQLKGSWRGNARLELDALKVRDVQSREGWGPGSWSDTACS